VAILSTPEFNATKVNPSSVRLAGVPPVKWSWPHVGQDCGCADRFRDIVLHFSTDELAAAIAEMESLPKRLELIGETWDGVPIRGSDSIRLVPPRKAY
jgi:hypothetical protein